MQKNGNSYVSLSFLAIILPVLLFSFFSISFPAQSATSGNITATVAVGICGNNIVEYGEDCDGSALDGQTCQSLGYDAGALTCGIGCDFYESDCVNLEPDKGGVVFSGKAYPVSVVRILKDGQIAATTAADGSGNFETTLSHLIVGSYLFSVYAYDNNGGKSKTLTYQKDVTKDEIQEISDIFVPPRIMTDKTDVEQGKKILFFGQSVAQSVVAISLGSDKCNFTQYVKSNGNGYFSYELDTDSLNLGSYKSWAKAHINESLSSADSEETSFQVSAKPSPSGQTKTLDGVDLTEWKRVPQTTVRKPAFSGTTNISEAVVRIEIRTKKNKRIATSQVLADAEGYWTWKNPVRLKRKTYIVQVTVSDSNEPSRNYSYLQSFKLVKKIKKSARKRPAAGPVASPPIKLVPLSQTASFYSIGAEKADANSDGRVNLIDASVSLDQFEKDDFSPRADANANGKTDLRDFSILMYYWSG